MAELTPWIKTPWALPQLYQLHILLPSPPNSGRFGGKRSTVFCSWEVYSDTDMRSHCIVVMLVPVDLSSWFLQSEAWFEILWEKVFHLCQTVKMVRKNPLLSLVLHLGEAPSWEFLSGEVQTPACCGGSHFQTCSQLPTALPEQNQGSSGNLSALCPSGEMERQRKEWLCWSVGRGSKQTKLNLQSAQEASSCSQE